MKARRRCEADWEKSTYSDTGRCAAYRNCALVVERIAHSPRVAASPLEGFATEIWSATVSIDGWIARYSLHSSRDKAKSACERAARRLERWRKDK